MLELRQQAEHYLPNFAGDIINFSLYLKRLRPAASVNFFSAIGADPISRKMQSYLSEEGINTDHVAISPNKTVGLYMVHTDLQGERTFSYWRSNSAARDMVKLTDLQQLEASLGKLQYLYFSGITLAVLEQDSREKLFSLAKNLRDQGKIIIFDPNYRAVLWPDLNEAKIQISRAYSLTNILLSSYDDEQALFGAADIDTTTARLRSYQCDEVVMTNGPHDIIAMDEQQTFILPAEKPTAVVDTTSAGDAFNAGYIAARHAGETIQVAVSKASSLASLVIAHPGAILPKPAFDIWLKQPSNAQNCMTPLIK